MRRVSWGEARAGDIVRTNGEELFVTDCDRSTVTVSRTAEGRVSYEFLLSALELVGATVYRPYPPLPQEVGAIVRVGGTEFMRVFTDPEARESKHSAWVIRKGYRPGDWIKSSWLQKQSFAMTVASEGVETDGE